MALKDWTLLGFFLRFYEFVRTSSIIFWNVVFWLMKRMYLMAAAVAWMVCRLIALIIQQIQHIYDIYTRFTEKQSATDEFGGGIPGVGPALQSYNWVDIANTFLPLDTLVAGLAIFTGVFITVVTYRFCKTWVPGIAT